MTPAAPSGETVGADDHESLVKGLGVHIAPETLRCALTHRSYAYENGGLPTNERLEFLGDAVLGLVSAEALEDALARFEGAVVTVTHDRWFARGFDRFLVFDEDGRVRESDQPDWAVGHVRRAR